MSQAVASHPGHGRVGRLWLKQERTVIWHHSPDIPKLQDFPTFSYVYAAEPRSLSGCREEVVRKKKAVPTQPVLEKTVLAGGWFLVFVHGKCWKWKREESVFWTVSVGHQEVFLLFTYRSFCRSVEYQEDFRYQNEPHLSFSQIS